MKEVGRWPTSASTNSADLQMLGPKLELGHVWTAPGWQGNFTSQDWSEQPCVRPICVVHMTAGHNALRGSGFDQKHAFEMRWPKWVVGGFHLAGATESVIPKTDEALGKFDLDEIAAAHCNTGWRAPGALTSNSEIASCLQRWEDASCCEVRISAQQFRNLPREKTSAKGAIATVWLGLS